MDAELEKDVPRCIHTPFCPHSAWVKLPQQHMLGCFTFVLAISLTLPNSHATLLIIFRLLFTSWNNYNLCLYSAFAVLVILIITYSSPPVTKAILGSQIMIDTPIGVPVCHIAATRQVIHVECDNTFANKPTDYKRCTPYR